MRRWTGVPLSVALLLAMMSSIGGTRPVSAASKTVSAWVTLASKNPAVGCVLDISVEARDSSGATLTSVEVLLGLVIDGEVYSANRAVTGDDGLVFLGLDTSEGYAGGNAQIDVNIGGAYMGGAQLTLTDDGPCAGNSAMWTETAQIDVVTTAAPDAPKEMAAAEAGSGGNFVWVPSYTQQRNLSCEYASLTIATGAFGDAVSEYEFDNRVGLAANPHWGYRGDITGWWGNTVDYGVYAEPLVAPLAQFGFNGEVFYSGGDGNELMARLDQGRPTLVWIALWGDLRETDYTEDGTPFALNAGIHVVVAYGYDAGGVYVSDPAVGAKRYYDWGTFSTMWSVLDGMGLSVSPM